MQFGIARIEMSLVWRFLPSVNVGCNSDLLCRTHHTITIREISLNISPFCSKYSLSYTKTANKIELHHHSLQTFLFKIVNKTRQLQDDHDISLNKEKTMCHTKNNPIHHFKKCSARSSLPSFSEWALSHELEI